MQRTLDPKCGMGLDEFVRNVLGVQIDMTSYVLVLGHCPLCMIVEENTGEMTAVLVRGKSMTNLRSFLHAPITARSIQMKTSVLLFLVAVETIEVVHDRKYFLYGEKLSAGSGSDSSNQLQCS